MFAETATYLRSVKDTYREETLEVLDFWHKHGVDWEKGGLITYVERDGTRWDDHKPGWFQGRSLYSFSKGYNDILPKKEWLDAARAIYRFLVEHLYVPGDAHGKMYYMLTREGEGREIAPNLFTETFALMGLSEYHKATGEAEALTRARRIYDESLLFYYRNPRFLREGALSDKKEKCPLSWYMMLLCSVQTLRGCDAERAGEYTAFLAEICDDVYRFYYDKSIDIFSEGPYDLPGHTCEVLWFMLAEGLHENKPQLIEHMAKMTATLFETCYDKEYGGLPLFKSLHGLPDRRENWDIRRWWVQNELLLALMYSYVGTKDERFLTWYRMVHEYVFAHFPDREYGEWFGCLHRDGTPVALHKGDELKGPYHLPRHFIAIYNLLDAIGV